MQTTTRTRSERGIHHDFAPPSRQLSAPERQTSEGDVYDDGYLRVEHEAYYVACGGRTIRLPRAEFLLFSRMARSVDRVVSSRDLWHHVWGDRKALNYESLHVYVHRLRGRLAPYGVLIETMVNVGYRLLATKPNDDPDKEPTRDR